MRLTRRELLWGAVGVGAAGGLGATWWAAADGTDAPGDAALGPPNAFGLRLPPGFSGKVIATTGQTVPGTQLKWPDSPDAGACFSRPGGGWTYVCNSEADGGLGGVVAVRFSASGEIVSADRLLGGTSRNCGGGATPWGTWLSGEEIRNGQIYECDPERAGSGVARPALGTFWHESTAVDPISGAVYMSEDRPDGRLYRFLPDRPADLRSGRLQAAAVVDGICAWVDVPPGAPERSPATTSFAGGEGIVIDGRTLFLTTKGDDRVWRIDLPTWRVSVFYDGRLPGSVLTGVDQVVMHPFGRDLFVAEDGGDMQLVRIVVDVAAGGIVGGLTPTLQFVGHDGSEISGPAFTPDGSRLYVSSQRGTDGAGLTVEITGPFDRWAETATVSGRWPARRIGVPAA